MQICTMRACTMHACIVRGWTSWASSGQATEKNTGKTYVDTRKKLRGKLYVQLNLSERTHIYMVIQLYNCIRKYMLTPRENFGARAAEKNWRFCQTTKRGEKWQNVTTAKTGRR